MWPFLERSPAIPLSIKNTLAGGGKTETASVMAVVDTGYGGFIMLPEELFKRLGFMDLRTETTYARLADGSVIRMLSSYGTIEISDVEVELDGRVQTCEGAEEILLGMDGIRSLALTIDSCSRESFARPCRPRGLDKV